VNRIRKAALLLLCCVVAAAALTSCAARLPVDTDIRDRAPDDETVVNLRYVTNREMVQSASGARHIGGKPGQLSAGYCKAAFEAGDRWGRILRIDSVSIDSLLDVPPAGRLVIYVHGYSESFDRSCRRAAVLQQKLRLDDRLILFSWPSGSYVSYSEDANALDRSLDQLNTFLSRAIEIVGQERIVLMAHSMGSRGVVNALQRREDDSGRFSHVVLLAPDIRRSAFFENLQMLQSKVADITVYTSDNDLVLWLSTVVNVSSRLGVADDVEFDPAHARIIDITSTGVSFVGGHLYHIFNAAVAEDLRFLLGSSFPGASRAWQRVPGTTDGIFRLERADARPVTAR
jgi:pimeloyl-ACP methyl ester carboxylesterase